MFSDAQINESTILKLTKFRINYRLKFCTKIKKTYKTRNTLFTFTTGGRQ